MNVQGRRFELHFPVSESQWQWDRSALQTGRSRMCRGLPSWTSSVILIPDLSVPLLIRVELSSVPFEGAWLETNRLSGGYGATCASRFSAAVRSLTTPKDATTS